jgi:hypothetical protein
MDSVFLHVSRPELALRRAPAHVRLVTAITITNACHVSLGMSFRVTGASMSAKRDNSSAQVYA